MGIIGDYEHYRVPATYQKLTPEERKQRVIELHNKVKENVVRIQSSEEFRNYLIAMSRFHNYSWNNQLLIWVQKPHATHVAGFYTWKDLGRMVKKGETGIAILAPLGATAATTFTRATDNAVWAIRKGNKGWEIVDGNGTVIQAGFGSFKAAAENLKGRGFVERRQMLSVNNFKVVHVFDISQTDGKPLPEFEVPSLTGAANPELMQGVLDVAAGQGVTVSFEPKPGQPSDIKGFFRAPDFIWVRPEEAPAQQLKTLLHELAHFHTDKVMRIDRADAETIAESAACVVGAYYGFDTGVRSFPYIALWAKDEKRLKANLTTIQEISEKMIDLLEKKQIRLPIPPPAPVAPREPTPVAPREPAPAAKHSPVMTVEQMETTYSLEKIKELARLREVSTAGSKRDIIKRLLA